MVCVPFLTSLSRDHKDQRSEGSPGQDSGGRRIPWWGCSEVGRWIKHSPSWVWSLSCYYFSSSAHTSVFIEGDFNNPTPSFSGVCQEEALGSLVYSFCSFLWTRLSIPHTEFLCIRKWCRQPFSQTVYCAPSMPSCHRLIYWMLSC